MHDLSAAGLALPSTQPLTTEQRITMLFEAVADDPDVIAVVIDENYGNTDLPPELASLFPIVIPLADNGDFVSPETAGELIQAVAEARRSGRATCIVSSRDEPDVGRRLNLVDLIDEHGCLIVMIASAPVEADLGRPKPERGVSRVMPSVARLTTDATAVVLTADEGAVQILGYSAEELIGNNNLDFLHTDDVDKAMIDWLAMLETDGAATQLILRYRRADGSWIWVEVTHRNLLSTKGYVEREFIDVSDRIRATVEAENKSRIIDGIADVLPSGIAHFDPDYNLQFANDLWRTMTGIQTPESIRTYFELVAPEGRDALRNLISDAREGNEDGGFEAEVTVKPADGSAHRRCRVTIRPLTDPDGENAGLVACLDDITEAWRLQQRLVEQATSDSLTGLANRGAIIAYLDDELLRNANTDTVIAVVFIDLNGFKRVNDVLGHGVGDGLIHQIGESLKSVVRASDVAARHGGDEFLVVLTDLDDVATAMLLARRLLDAATGQFFVDGHAIEVSASCGVAVDVGGKHTAERLIAEADLAMYEQKHNGTQDPSLFEATMFEDQRHELNRDAALRHAATDGSLVLHYQPIVDVATSEVVGYEALLRWTFEGQLVAPDSFIGLAERRGLINEIGAWVLDQVVARAAQDERRDLLWTLNVSPVQLRDGSFDMLVAAALTRHGLDPAQLGLELTEGVLVARNGDTYELLDRLDAMGVSLLVDDFGTGYASLDYLRTLPVHGLKVDRCFTADVLEARTGAIIGNVISLAKSLGVRLVIEGVETDEQREELIRLGATVAQGYFFGRPEPLPDLSAPTEQPSSNRS